MKIKQSFIDRCGEITVNQIMEISAVTGFGTGYVIFCLYNWSMSTEIIKATANVLKIDLSDIYEVEPNTLTE